ncbi:hypothetical protein BaRGS_00020569, partial [Batillaria attramentaria]
MPLNAASVAPPPPSSREQDLSPVGQRVSDAELAVANEGVGKARSGLALESGGGFPSWRNSWCLRRAGVVRRCEHSTGPVSTGGDCEKIHAPVFKPLSPLFDTPDRRSRQTPVIELR